MWCSEYYSICLVFTALFLFIWPFFLTLPAVRAVLLMGYSYMCCDIEWPVCLCVGHMGKPCKNGWTNHDGCLCSVVYFLPHAAMITQRLLIYSKIWLILCEAASRGPSPTSDILVMVVSSSFAFFLTPMHHQNGLFCVKWDVRCRLVWTKGAMC